MSERLFASGEDLELAQRVSELAYANPFTEERVLLERAILGSQYVPGPPAWTLSPTVDSSVNAVRITPKVEALLAGMKERLRRGARLGAEQKSLFRDVALYAAFDSVNDRLFDLVVESERPGARRLRAPFFEAWAERLGRDLGAIDQRPSLMELGHLFACLFQVRRAFHHVFHRIVGVSAPAARLRGQVWQSIFTHDLRRYERALYAKMVDLPTLVTGPSGSGKELVVRAVALSRYIEFNLQSLSFEADFDQLLFPLNVAALPATLVESELFGHRRGTFTGATRDRIGWLEECGAQGTVFLDEIGDLDSLIQVKLLRVLQTRSFQRLGETTLRNFSGKVITATHRDLPDLIQRGQFREDLFYRLCADQIVTPSLVARLQDSPAELEVLLVLLATRWLGKEEGPALAREVEQWIRTHLPADYPWPGNVRELEQCIRSVLIRREYHPPRLPDANPSRGDLAQEIAQGQLTAEELLAKYTRHLIQITGSQTGAAERLALDRRTVARYAEGPRGRETKQEKKTRSKDGAG